MTFIDSRSYDQYEMWKRYGKSTVWLRGYRAAFSKQKLVGSLPADFKEGYRLGAGDLERDKNPPYIRGGFSYGHEFDPEASD